MTPTSNDSHRKGSHVVVENLTVTYEAREAVEAVKGVSIEVKPGEFVCILGVTGCGKSTLLNAIGGFVAPTAGRVLVDGTEVEEPSPARGVVFQQFALFPWRTVLGNVCFGPRARGMPGAQAHAIARKYLEMVGLQEYGSMYPHELSGGMKQRVGLARALANDPPLLLMDEPLGSVDAQTRVQLQELLLRIWSGSDKTVVFVTHDIDEAIFLADRIIVLTARPGRVKETIPVTLARPRSYDVVTSAAYLDIKKRILALIREETFKANGGAPSAARSAIPQ
jgi:NitT/TauT family transport system ATP-binding protein